MLHYICHIIFGTLYSAHYICHITFVTIHLSHCICHITFFTLHLSYYICHITFVTLNVYDCFILFWKHKNIITIVEHCKNCIVSLNTQLGCKNVTDDHGVDVQGNGDDDSRDLHRWRARLGLLSIPWQELLPQQP